MEKEAKQLQQQFPNLSVKEIENIIIFFKRVSLQVIESYVVKAK
jgi:hypothetical protein